MAIQPNFPNKSNKKYFFLMVFCRRANSIGFYNKIIKKKGFNSKF
nr:MAG TPA: hypothetical protein [Bacteriophage sp.]